MMPAKGFRTVLLMAFAGAIAALLASFGIGDTALAESDDAGGETVVIELRIWQNVEDAEDVWVSARPQGGDWDTLGTVPFRLDSHWAAYSDSSVHHYKDLAIAGVELRVWQRAEEPESIYVGGCASVCAPPARVGRSAVSLPAWGPLGKIALPLDDGHSRSGRYRYGNLAIAVPRGNPGLLADREHLLALRDVFEGGSAELNWNAGTPAASWEGVTVSGSPARVTGLNLSERGLAGEIWGWLGDLTELTELRLDGNTLKGGLPSKLVLLKNLADLHLGGNGFEGCIPLPLRTVANNDLDALNLRDCPDPTFHAV